MLKHSSMTGTLRRQFGKMLSVILSIAMLMTLLPADMLGGIASLKAKNAGASYLEYQADDIAPVGTTEGTHSAPDEPAGTHEAAEKVAKPAASVAAGTYTSNQSVELSAVEDAKIYYTVDGSVPTKESLPYVGAIAVQGKKGESVTVTIKAIAVKKGYEDSDVAEFAYVINLPAGSTGPMVMKKASVDLTEGLVTTGTYGTPGAVTITVLDNMPYKAEERTIDGVTHPGFVAGKVNPHAGQLKENSTTDYVAIKTGIPTGGAAFKIVADVNGSIAFTTKGNTGKPNIVVDTVDGTAVNEKQDKDIPEGDTTFALEAGHVYYYYAGGSKLNVYAINYKYETESDYKISKISAGTMDLDTFTFTDKNGTKEYKGLMAGKAYGTDPDVATFTVLDEGMKWVGGESDSVTIEGKTYPGYVQGFNNAKDADGGNGAWRAKGAVLQIDSKVDGTFAVVISAAKNGGKTYYFVEQDGEIANVIADNVAFETGTKKFEVKAGKKYQFYAQGSKACIYDAYVECGTKARAEWSTVAAPVINADQATTDENGALVVLFTMIIGDDGADSVTVEMYDADGTLLDTQLTKVEGATGTVKFNPPATGSYTFRAIASREEEEDKVGEMSAPVAYTLPLATPIVKNFTNKGPGKVQIGWGRTPEADYYLLSYKEEAEGAQETEQIKITPEMNERTSKEWAYTLENKLTVGKSYTVYVQAVRIREGVEEKSKEKGALEKVVANDKMETTYSFASFGASTSLSSGTYDFYDGLNADGSVKLTKKTSPKNGYEGNANEGKVTVWSQGGSGKIVPLSTDGIAFYYTQVDPINENFVLKAKAHVDSWNYSNGQDGFGLLVTDRVGDNGDTTDPFWNNSYMAAVTKIEYRWNKEAGELTTDPLIGSTSMKLGVGTIARTGAPAGWKSSNLPPNFTSTTATLEYSCNQFGPGTYNIVGNRTNPDPSSDQPNLITDFNLMIERSNTGYQITYLDLEGNVIESKMWYDEKYFDETGKYTGTYDPENKSTNNGLNGTMMQMDSEAVYVGFFAARNATVTFSDIDFKVTDARTDPAAEERVKVLVDPNFSIASASNASSANYDLQFFSNVPGYVTITRADGSYVTNNYRIDKEDTKLHFAETLKRGKNTYTWVMKPDADYEIGGKGSNTYLKDYNVKTEDFTVTYATFGNKYIYVSPDATAKGKGTAEDPVDIYTAVRYVGPGQTILLAGGTYKLTSSLSISRGISGTVKMTRDPVTNVITGGEVISPIRMIADPASKERPVLDFGKNYKTGMKLSGDGWILQGFDVTNSGDGTDGLQVCGNFNVIDSLRTYRNGNTGIQLSRLAGSDATQADWPSFNLVKNCTSYLNADLGYEDADGFAAKLTTGPGNVFDGCIAAYNADDGWDLFAKIETGPIGTVTIQNSIAYGNGYVFDEKGNKIDAGNGNGFKMGGSSVSGPHLLKNSIAFNNKAKGIDSNSGPDIQAQNCITFNNESYNIAMYTGNGVDNTAYKATGVISYRTIKLDQKEQLNGKGTQPEADIYNDTNYFWDEAAKVSKNKSGATVAADWFVSLEAPADGVIVDRNADGTINLGDFLKLTDKAPAGVGARDLDLNGSKSDYITEEILEKEKAELIKQGLVIQPIDDQIYTGQAIRPALLVSDGVSYLTSKDYTVTYRDNLNVGTATVTIRGKGNYTSVVETTFNILPKNLSEDDITLQMKEIVLKDTGKAQQPKPVVMWGKKKLALNKDYMLKYYAQADFQVNGTNATELQGITEMGRYVIAIVGNGTQLGNFTGVTYGAAAITDPAHMISKATVKLGMKTMTATGKGVEFEGTDNKNSKGATIYVAMGSTPLTYGLDYILEYEDNVLPGKAAVIVRGINAYAGEKKTAFTIKGVDIRRAVVEGMKVNGKKYNADGKEDASGEIYRGEQYQGEAVKLSGLTLSIPKSAITGVKTDTAVVPLVTGTDFTVSYKNNNRAGSAQIIFTGTGMYSGKLTKTFRILPADIADEYSGTIEGADATAPVKGHIIVEGLEEDYVKGATTLTELTIKYYNYDAGKTFYLTPGKDYTAKYSKNTKAAKASDGANAPTVTIVGKGGYTGRLEKKFTINPKKLDTTKIVNRVEKEIEVTLKDMPYSTKKNGWKSKVAVKDMNNRAMALKTDYVIEYRYGSGEKLGLEVGEMDAPAAGTVINVVLKPGTSGNYIGEKVVPYTVYDPEKDLKAAKVEQTGDLLYTGEAILMKQASEVLKITAKDGTVLVYGKDYEVVKNTYYGNINKGTARVTIRGIGEYGGLKVVSYKITAKELKKVSPAVENIGQMLLDCLLTL